ncbi:hypothetical protein CHLRE_17g746747v5 [Chlamydomonas reinhardtii]|uniref:Uncharacterized protein n=1 Tax=Chlamydomonas reinhardtii TaxID=3055 RepID=A0A2K3CS40_CHLRE|nr:uncharacterized protein CHLRE_17g746747v5 [Chlamydomonas reinhardtii]PNW71104.1 hypothetical protein CHLRE_17g746747v5 [Chlamydomonas reinhardtii]
MKPSGTTRAAELASCIRENSDARAGAPAFITAYRVRPGTEALVEPRRRRRKWSGTVADMRGYAHTPTVPLMDRAGKAA